MTVYLKFASQDEAIAALKAAGFTLSEYSDHCHSTDGWGSLFSIPEQSGHFCNLYDTECPSTLKSYEVAAPATPYNQRW